MAATPVHGSEMPERKDPPYSHAIGYMCKYAKIPFEIISDAIKRGIIYESEGKDGAPEIVFSSAGKTYAEIIEIRKDRRYVASSDEQAYWAYDPNKIIAPPTKLKESGEGTGKIREDTGGYEAYLCDSAIEALSLYALLPDELRRRCVIYGCGRDSIRGSVAAYDAATAGLTPVIASAGGSFRKRLRDILPSAPVISPDLISWNLKLGGSSAHWSSGTLTKPDDGVLRVSIGGKSYEVPYGEKPVRIIGKSAYILDDETGQYIPVSNGRAYYELNSKVKVSGDPNKPFLGYTYEKFEGGVKPLEQWIREGLAYARAAI